MPSITIGFCRAVATAAFTVLLAAGSPAAAQTPALANKAAQVDKILNETQSKGRARVIVELKVPEVAIQSEGGMVAHKANVRAVQDAIISQTLGRSNGVSRMTISPMFSTHATLAEIEKLAADPRVVKIYPNRLNKPNLVQSVPLVRGNVLRSRGGDGSGQIVAVIDTGVKRNHEFLQDKVLIGACFSNDDGAGGFVSTCPNGQGHQIGIGAGEPCQLPGCDHGTHVAGIAVGRNTDPDSGEPRFGVAPQAALIAINVFTDAISDIGAFDSDILLGLEFVLDRRNTFGNRKIASVNMSLGDGVSHASKCDADSPLTGIVKQLRNAEIATVISSGNDHFRNGVSYPGCISQAVTVGASTKADKIAGFSNMGALVDVMAPGHSIQSSVTPNGYAFFSGTSMAAPHVAGAFAALRTLHPSKTVLDIEKALKATGKPIEDTRNNGTFTRRRIKLDSAENELDGAAAAVAGTAVISVEPAAAAE